VTDFSRWTPQQRGPKPDLIGSFIVQSLLQYSDAVSGPLVSCFLKLNQAELLTLALSQTGSRVLELFMSDTARAVHQKQREKLIDRLKDCGAIAILATSQFGSFVLEKVYNSSNLQRRTWISEELSLKLSELKDDPIGFRAVKKCRVEEFINRKEAWMSKESTRNTRQNMFSDIIEDVGTNRDDELQEKPKRRKSKKSKPTTEKTASTFENHLKNLVGTATEEDDREVRKVDTDDLDDDDDLNDVLNVLSNAAKTGTTR